MLRPEKMGWADIVLEKRSSPVMFEVIASTGLFQPDSPDDLQFHDWNEVSPVSAAVRELRARIRPYEPYLPLPDMNAATAEERAAPFPDIADDIERRVDGWLEIVKPDLERLSSLEQQHETLLDLKSVLRLLPSSIQLELWHTYREQGRTYLPLVLCGSAEDAARFLGDANDARLQGHFEEQGTLATVTALVGHDELQGMTGRCRQYGLRVLEVPQWLTGPPDAGIDQINAHVEELEREITDIRERVAKVSEEYRMAGLRWLVERQDWIEGVLEQAQQGKHFVHLGGWVPRDHYPQLVDKLKQAGKPFLIRLDGGGSHGVSPTMLRNPAWARSFELFVRGFGIPASDEVDPSMILAVVTPLMFGYMFGDVGQGLLLVLVGWLLWDRFSWIRLLVPAGISAVAFGFLYGSVFSVEHWIPALWLHPMEEPLVVLGAPLLFGALLMLLSLTFGYAEACWRGRGRDWLLHNLPLLLCYLAPAVWFVSPATGLVMVLGAIVMLLYAAGGGGRERAGKRLVAAPAAALELLESWFQLMINTLSFARLGAFSLAHAGLSMALVSLAELPESVVAVAVIMVAGNLLITALEGLVVSVQTTRLVMFEFFRRFFEGSGRGFRPLTLGGHPGGGGA